VLVTEARALAHIAEHSSATGLTTAEAAIIAAACTAAAVLIVGLLNVFSQRKQLINQEKQSDRQLKEQRQLLERQLQAQREQNKEQLDAQRAQFDRQMDEQRRMQLAEFDVERDKIIRGEKKAVYASMLAGCREVQAMWQLVADQHPQSLVINAGSMLAQIEKNREAIRTGMAEIELIGSEEVVTLVLAYTGKTGTLLSNFIEASESAIARVGEPTVETLAEAQAVVRNEISTGEITRIFAAMRENMRSEIRGDE
jgi:hypothetical protein